MDKAVERFPNYWIEYLSGHISYFYAKSEEAARHRFMMEGDHAWNYGRVENRALAETDQHEFEELGRLVRYQQALPQLIQEV